MIIKFKDLLNNFELLLGEKPEYKDPQDNIDWEALGEEIEKHPILNPIFIYKTQGKICQN